MARKRKITLFPGSTGRSSALRVSGAATWETALVIQPDDAHGADLETVLLEGDIRCVRAGESGRLSQLLEDARPMFVVVDPLDERLRGVDIAATLLAAPGAPAIAIVSIGLKQGQNLTGGAMPEVQLPTEFSPKQLRDAIKRARKLLEAPPPAAKPPAPHLATTKRAGFTSPKRRDKGRKGSTSRYDEGPYDTTGLVPEDGRGDGPKDTAGRRKRFKTTLSFKAHNVMTTPTPKALAPRQPARDRNATGALKFDNTTQKTRLADGHPKGRIPRPSRGWQRVPARRLRRAASRLGEAQGYLDPGTVIDDRYRVVGVLGSGGMATVYQCSDMELDEDVALKLIKADRNDDSTLRRFRHEMRVCRRLSHPNIVRTYEFGMWEGRRFITMELLDGRDLSQLLLIAQGPLARAHGIDLIMQTCRGLAAAHEDGVIHRDVKPHNLFVVEDGAVLKIMDFGIAKTEDATLTNPGGDRVLGTPAYLAPERLKKKAELSAKTDIYSLGVVMYQVFTGELPFVGPDISTLLASIVLEEPLPPTEIAPNIPAALEATILRAMTKEPSGRHDSCQQILDELAAIS